MIARSESPRIRVDCEAKKGERELALRVELARNEETDEGRKEGISPENLFGF